MCSNGGKLNEIKVLDSPWKYERFFCLLLSNFSPTFIGVYSHRRARNCLILFVIFIKNSRAILCMPVSIKRKEEMMIRIASIFLSYLLHLLSLPHFLFLNKFNFSFEKCWSTGCKVLMSVGYSHLILSITLQLLKVNMRHTLNKLNHREIQLLMK